MKALSVQNPMAWLLCAGIKPVENRTWSTRFRGRIYVHAGLRYYKVSPGNVFDFISQRMTTAEYHRMIDDPRSLPVGGIIGEVDIVDCVETHPSRWFTGPYAFVIDNPVLYDQVIPCRGYLGFFSPKFEGGDAVRTRY